MGQYYKPCLIKDNITVYNRRVEPDCDYVMAKLMEHSWWNNPTCNAVAKLLYKSKGNLFWCGDYADDQAIHHYIWNVDGESLPNPEGFTLDGKFIVNHSLKKYIDCDKYYKESLDGDGWCIHPLSLLTALGNGRGGGDYYDGYVNANKVGYWAGDLISIEDEAPKNNEESNEEKWEEFEIVFKEKQK